jgi:hypothetical protein
VSSFFYWHIQNQWMFFVCSSINSHPDSVLQIRTYYIMLSYIGEYILEVLFHSSNAHLISASLSLFNTRARREKFRFYKIYNILIEFTHDVYAINE